MTEKTIRIWVANGMPQIGYGRYDVAVCVQWKIDQVASDSAKDEPGSETDTARRELYIAQRHKIELEIAERRRELLPACLVDAVLGEILAIASVELDAIGPRLVDELVPVDDPAWIQQRLFTECRAVRSSIADQIRNLAQEMASRADEDLAV